MIQPKWCLILVIWGDAYPDHHVNVLARAARRFSPSLGPVIVVTDRVRPGLDSDLVTKPFPADFQRPEFFKGGYPAKLSFFHREIVPPDMPCLYLDLDTLVLGDLGRLTGLLRDPDDILMLPPGNLIGFSAARRLLFLLSGGRRMACGNSSIVVFHSGASHNLCEVYVDLWRQFGLSPAHYTHNDDLFISWFGQRRLRGIPTSLGVMLRREFLSRTRIWSGIKGRLPWVRARRNSLVAITFNGNPKSAEFATLSEGAILQCERGRHGRWQEPEFAPLMTRIIRAASELVDVPGP